VKLRSLEQWFIRKPAINKLYHGRVTKEKQQNQCAVLGVTVAVATVETVQVFVRRW